MTVMSQIRDSYKAPLAVHSEGESHVQAVLALAHDNSTCCGPVLRDGCRSSHREGVV
jgi:hypothetical protein